MLTNNNNPDGYGAVEYLGVVTDETVRAINIFRYIGSNMGCETFAEMIMATACGTAARVCQTI